MRPGGAGVQRLILLFERRDGVLQGRCSTRLQLSGSGSGKRVTGENQAELGEADEATSTLSPRGLGRLPHLEAGSLSSACFCGSGEFQGGGDVG